LPFEGANEIRWIGEHFNLVDDEGYFTQIDGSRSRVIHQFDRFGRFNNHGLNNWLKRPNIGLWWDPMPVASQIPDFSPDDAFSACVLVLEDNHRLPEWIAYHYYALPLRHMVVAVDPQSKTSINKYLKKWRTRMTVEAWTDETFTALNLTRDDADDLITATKKQQTRKRSFYEACTKYHQQFGRRWTTYTDADEVWN